MFAKRLLAIQNATASKVAAYTSAHTSESPNFPTVAPTKAVSFTISVSGLNAN